MATENRSTYTSMDYYGDLMHHPSSSNFTRNFRTAMLFKNLFVVIAM